MTARILEQNVWGISLHGCKCPKQKNLKTIWSSSSLKLSWIPNNQSVAISSDKRTKRGQAGFQTQTWEEIAEVYERIGEKLEKWGRCKNENLIKKTSIFSLNMKPNGALGNHVMWRWCCPIENSRSLFWFWVCTECDIVTHKPCGFSFTLHLFTRNFFSISSPVILPLLSRRLLAVSEAEWSLAET